MEKSVFSWIIRHSKQQQIVLVLMAFINMPFTMLGYRLQETIINEAIQGIIKTDKGAVDMEFPVALFGFGPSVDQITYLFVLSGLFLANILLLQGIKYALNVFRGVTAERMLRRLRFSLVQRVLRFPKRTFNKVSQGELISMIIAEVEPLGGFVGESFSLPVMQGGIMLMSLGYMLYANWVMAAAAVALYPLQFYLIPKLQKRVNMLGKERVKRARKLSEKIGETVAGVEEVHVHDTSALELAGFANRLNEIFQIRFQIYKWKFVIKFVNNFIQQLGPVLFYSIGGYLVIKGELDVGTLFAAISAHKDIGAPWKELLGYYQRQADARIKYEQVVEQFDPAGMLPESHQTDEPETPVHYDGELQVANVSLMDDQQNNVVDAIGFSSLARSKVAIVGGAGSGKDELTRLVARLVDPDKGTISIGGHSLADLPETVTGRRAGFVGPTATVFNMTLGDNLFYSLKHRPLKPMEYDKEGQAVRDNYIHEAKASANFEFDLNADWIDYDAIGVKDASELRRAAVRALRTAGLEEDTYTLGLRGSVSADSRPDVVEGMLKARKALSDRMAEDPELASLIEPFDPDTYNTNSTVAENLLFGTPVGDAFDLERLAEHPFIKEVLERVGLADKMVGMGYQVAATMVELFADLPPDHELFQQFSFIAAEELPEYQALLAQYKHEQLDDMKAEEQLRLMSLPFKLTPARHRLGIVDDEVREQILAARRDFAENLPDDLKGAVAFFDPENYNAAANLQDNVLFGKVAYGQASAQERVGAMLREVMIDLNLYDTVSEVGLDYDVGIGGSRLSAAQRQKLVLARAVIKQPDILILSEATAPLDGASQTQIMDRLLDEFDDRGLFWALHKASDAARFDYVLVLKGGSLVGKGTFDELNEDGSALRELIDAE